MKKLAYLVAAVLMTAALNNCSAFTAPADPETGIRQDAPVEWDETPNPLDTPQTEDEPPEAIGRFGPHSEYWF